MKISQTWLASQTGVSDCWISGPRPLAALGAAGDEVPEAAAEVGAAEEGVERRPEPEDRRADVGAGHGPASVGGA